ncbi:MAG: hypothetical protein A2Y10_10380 [Planctomycetes bacterium GWF2_41_51]|nr:MAG: hypothetical protein A2Y10_10380 [Planctomycetes bacterium GWF2_41_51]HBG27652.1 hypothetical protein [Phycisphaerales bacterium]
MNKIKKTLHKNISIPIIVSIREQCSESALSAEVKVKILSQGGQIWIGAEGYGEKCADEGEGFPIGIEIWQGRLRLIVFNDINNEEPQIIDLENARETCRIGND